MRDCQHIDVCLSRTARSRTCEVAQQAQKRSQQTKGRPPRSEFIHAEPPSTTPSSQSSRKDNERLSKVCERRQQGCLDVEQQLRLRYRFEHLPCSTSLLVGIRCPVVMFCIRAVGRMKKPCCQIPQRPALPWLLARPGAFRFLALALAVRSAPAKSQEVVRRWSPEDLPASEVHIVERNCLCAGLV